MEAVKKHDFESYVAGLLIPSAFRPVYFVIRAFNVEIASIRDQVPRNTLHAGRIRFQYWRDVLDKSFAGNKQLSNSHPIANLLPVYIEQCGLSKRWFERCLESR